MDDQGEPNNRYIEKMEKHSDNTRSNIHYSLERFDLLIISISTASLGFSMAFIKDIIPDLSAINLTLLKISWILFGIAIITNLFSQVTSYYANKFELLISRNLIRGKRGKEHIGNQHNYECKKSFLDVTTKILNWNSFICLIIGIVIFIIFVNKYI